MDRGSGSNGSGANLPAVRGHNDALVLALLREAGIEGLGRTDLAVLTRLTPQAVSKIAARLRAEGLVAEAGRGASTGGKPRTLLQLAAGARHAVGVHADRDEMRAVRVDMLGTVVERFRGPWTSRPDRTSSRTRSHGPWTGCAGRPAQGPCWAWASPRRDRSTGGRAYWVG